MPATTKEAYDDITSMFLTAWNANATGFVGYTPEILYQMTQKEHSFNGELIWGKFNLTTTTRNQSTLSDINGQRRYESSGTMDFILNIPMSQTDVLTTAQDLCNIVEIAFEGKLSANGVEFFNVTSTELGRVDGWYLMNTTLTFKYSEIR